MQRFKCKTLVATINDANTETTLTPLDFRYVVIYVGLQYDQNDKLDAALSSVLEMVRDR